MGSLVAHLMEVGHPCRGALDAELLHLTCQQRSGSERSVDFTKVGVVFLEEVHHVLIGDINVGVATQTTVFLNSGLASGERPLDLLLDRGDIVPQEQGGFRLTAAHLVPGHPHSEVMVGR